MNKLNFTKAALAALPAKEARQYFQDTKEKRLGLYVTKAGSKSFFAKLTIDGKTVRRTLGKFPDLSIPLARNKAIEAAALVAQGSDPLALKRAKVQADVTLQQVLNDYIENHDLKDSTAADYRRAIGTAAGDWLNKPLCAITEKKLLTRYTSLAKTTKARTDNFYRVLKALFNYAKAAYKKEDDSSCFPNNPTQVIKDANVRIAKNIRKGKLSKDQLPVFWDTTQSLTNPAARECLLFLLLTGTRHHEATELTWENVDIKNSTFHLPTPKNNIPVTLPLPGYIKTLIAQHENKKGLVFPSPTRKCGVDLRHAVKEIKKALNDDSFIIHNLRRGFISTANGLDINGYTVKALVNHSAGDVTSDYNVPDIEDLQTAASKVENRIINHCVGESPNVIQLKAV